MSLSLSRLPPLGTSSSARTRNYIARRCLKKLSVLCNKLSLKRRTRLRSTRILLFEFVYVLEPCFVLCSDIPTRVYNKNQAVDYFFLGVRHGTVCTIMRNIPYTIRLPHYT